MLQVLHRIATFQPPDNCIWPSVAAAEAVECFFQVKTHLFFVNRTKKRGILFFARRSFKFLASAARSSACLCSSQISVSFLCRFRDPKQRISSFHEQMKIRRTKRSPRWKREIWRSELQKRSDFRELEQTLEVETSFLIDLDQKEMLNQFIELIRIKRGIFSPFFCHQTTRSGFRSWLDEIGFSHSRASSQRQNSDFRNRISTKTVSGCWEREHSNTKGNFK